MLSADGAILTVNCLKSRIRLKGGSMNFVLLYVGDQRRSTDYHYPMYNLSSRV